MKRTSVKSSFPVLLVAFWVLLLGIRIQAEPILYTFSGTGTGTFDEQGFTNASFTIGVFADTTNVESSTCQYSVAGTKSAISVNGVGLGFFTTTKKVIRSNSYPGSSYYNGDDLLDFADNIFADYDLQTSFGPTADMECQPGTLAINEPTTFGVISFSSLGGISVNVTTGDPEPPQITTQPTNQTVLAGDSASFSAEFSGAVPLNYYWQHAGAILPGSANPLLLTNAQDEDAGDYAIVVENMFGCVTSQVATLTVIPSAPNFKVQPVSRVLMPGTSTVSFSATVNGTSPVYWQWYFNDSPIADENSSQLTITDIQEANLGNYWAVVTNIYGAATSSVATLSRSSVLAWGTFNSGNSSLTNMPASLTNVIAMAAGDSHGLALRADGTVVAWGNDANGQADVPPDLTNVVSVAAGSAHSLALKRDGTLAIWGRLPLIGDPALGKIPADATNIAALALGPGAQHALVLRADGTVLDWGDANYGLGNAPTIARDIVAVASGSTHALALRADGRVVSWGFNPYRSTVPFSATNIVAIATSWYGNAALRADGTMLTWGEIVTPPPFGIFANAIDVVCPFNNLNSDVLGLRRSGTLLEYSHFPAQYPTNNITAIAAGSYTAFAAVGNGPPVFPGLPVNRTVPAGSRAYFRAVASGAMPISYQWLCNGTNVPGATNTFLALTNVQPIQIGSSFSLVASNTFGSATNGAMFLNVVPMEFSLRPQTTTAAVGATVTFSIANMFGQGPFTYQWQRDNQDISGATNAYLSLTNVRLDQSGAYSLLVNNGYGTVTNTATLTVTPLMFNTSALNPVISTNGFQFTLTSVFATNAVVIFASTNMVNWVPILTNPPATGSVQFLDPGATNYPQRYYRASEQ